MKELSTNELHEINGGFPFILIPLVVLVAGMVKGCSDGANSK